MISDIPKSRVRKQHCLYSLYELSKDIDRNKSDHDFVMPSSRPEPNTSASNHANEREIIYFVDSNIAIGFVTPYLSYKGLIGDFGSFRRSQDQDSRHDSKDHDDKHERSKDLRTILLMLSTEYIFSKDLVGKKYGLHLTPWHRQEITHHLIDTHSECMRRLSEVGGKSMFTAEIVSRLRTIAENASPKNEPQFLKLADSIANEEVVVPLHLIDRILNGEFFRSDIETRKLTKGNLSGNWKSTINYRSKQKSEIKESTDALSLSYMQWIADNALDENKRLVFITMDDNLSDWYNHWFYGDHADGGYIPKNYIVRKLSQYLPQLNLTNARNILSDEESEKSGEIFNKIRQVVELIIAPDMLRLLNKKFEILTNDDFVSYESMNRMSTSLKSSVGKTLDGLADIEKKSIFLFGEYLGQRIPQKLLEIANRLGEDDVSDKIERYLQEKSDPKNAIDYFAEDLPNVDQAIWRRIPQTLHYPVGEKNLYRFIQDAIERGSVDKATIKQLSPPAIFAVCAGIIHATKNEYAPLRLAARYAQLSFEFSSQEDGHSDGLMASEAKFLCAVSHRFIIGHAETIQAATKDFKKYSALLDEVTARPTIDESDTVRFDAERGAGLMFMAAHCFMNDMNDEGHRYLADAEILLTQCRARKDLFGEGIDSEPEVKRHYTHNLAAIYVLKALTTSEVTYDASYRDVKLSVQKILGILERQAWRPPLFLLAELYYFLSLDDDSYVPQAKAYIDQYLSQEGQKLTVDRWQAENMSRKLSYRQ